MSVNPNPLIGTRKNLAQAQQQESNPLYGIYQGEVRRTDDYSRSGVIQVFVAALAKDASIGDGLIECTWTSPFAGSTPVIALGKNVEKYEETQKSYGMWMVPPDIGNTVLVAFGDGNIKFGCKCVNSNHIYNIDWYKTREFVKSKSDIRADKLKELGI